MSPVYSCRCHKFVSHGFTVKWGCLLVCVYNSFGMIRLGGMVIRPDKIVIRLGGLLLGPGGIVGPDFCFSLSYIHFRRRHLVKSIYFTLNKCVISAFLTNQVIFVFVFWFFVNHLLQMCVVLKDHPKVFKSTPVCQCHGLGKNSSITVPHLCVWLYYISALWRLGDYKEPINTAMCGDLSFFQFDYLCCT